MYNESSLIALFRSSPIVFDEEVGIYQFTIEDNRDFRLTLFLIVCEGAVSIRLTYKNITVYEASTKYDGDVKAETDKLLVTKEKETTPIAQIMIVPNVVPFSAYFNLKIQSKQKISLTKEEKSLLKYNDFDLAVLFCNYPKVIDQEAQIFEYSICDERGFVLTLRLGVHDRCAMVLLEFEGQQVYKVEVDQVVEIKAEKDHFKIFREHDDEDSVIKVMVVPDLTPNSSLFTLDLKL